MLNFFFPLLQHTKMHFAVSANVMALMLVSLGGELLLLLNVQTENRVLIISHLTRAVVQVPVCSADQPWEEVNRA